METDLPVLEEIGKASPKLPTPELPPSEPPTQAPPQPPTQQPTLPPKLPSIQEPAESVNNAAKTLNVFPPISPVPERKNPNEPMRRTCSVITPHKAAPS